MKMRTVEVGSHIAKISFGGAQIPLGFLASHRKKSHLICESNYGFVVLTQPGTKKKINMVCECVTPRAAKKLRQVGVAGFELLGEEWLAAEKIKIAEHEARCEREGFDAAPEVTCPYPAETDQALAWEEGRRKKRAST
jgi:hypothetical protein